MGSMELQSGLRKVLVSVIRRCPLFRGVRRGSTVLTFPVLEILCEYLRIIYRLQGMQLVLKSCGDPLAVVVERRRWGGAFRVED